MASSGVWKIETFNGELSSATRLRKRKKVEKINCNYNKDQKTIAVLILVVTKSC